MEKKKKNKIILNLLATVATVSALLGTFATFASASDVQTDPSDVLVPSIPLESISHEYITNFGTSNVFSGVYENPFVFYDSGLNTGRRGKAGVVLNYPYQSGDFTDVGRTIYYDFDLYKRDGYSQADITIPLTYSDGRKSRNPFNSARSTMYFSDFAIDVDSEALFYIYNSVSGNQLHPTYYDVSFGLVVLTENKSNYKVVRFEDRVEGDELYLSSTYFSDLCESYLEDDYTSFYIVDLVVEFYPFDGYAPSVSSDSMSVGTTYITTTLTDEGAASENVKSWYWLNPIVVKEFIGIGDVSVVDWITVAVGGFFDFEIMPNVTLGGIGLLSLAVALFMLIIRIYKG